MKNLTFTFIAVLFFAFTPKLKAHCEVPCGIYNDSLRIVMLYEHVSTIEKAMLQISTLEKTDGASNQLVRWVMNKEEHAEEMQKVITQYFMFQRIKPKKEGEAGRDVYLKQLELMHRLSILAMKSKQTIDTDLISEMQNTIHAFEHVYFHKH